MKKLLKTILASFMILTLTVLSSCWLDAAEPLHLHYDSIEAFVSDFGTKIEKKESTDACCLFDYNTIKDTVEQNLLCNMEFDWCYTSVISSGGDLKPQRYEYEEFQYMYMLKKEDKYLGEIVFTTTPLRCFSKSKLDVVYSEPISEAKVDISFEVKKYDGKEEHYWHATVYIEETIVNEITMIFVDGELKKSFSVELFVDIIKPLITSTYIIK